MQRWGFIATTVAYLLLVSEQAGSSNADTHSITELQAQVEMQQRINAELALRNELNKLQREHRRLKSLDLGIGGGELPPASTNTTNNVDDTSVFLPGWLDETDHGKIVQATVFGLALLSQPVLWRGSQPLIRGIAAWAISLAVEHHPARATNLLISKIRLPIMVGTTLTSIWIAAAILSWLGNLRELMLPETHSQRFNAINLVVTFGFLLLTNSAVKTISKSMKSAFLDKARREEAHPSFLKQRSIINSVAKSGDPRKDFFFGTAGIKRHGPTWIFFQSMVRPSISSIQFFITMTLFLFLTGFDFIAYMVSISLIAYGSISVFVQAFGTIQNLAGTMLIATENPFSIGDIVQIGSKDPMKLGFIETFDSRCTTIRNFDGKPVLVPNSIFIKEPIQNWTRRPRKLIKMDFWLDLRNESLVAERYLDMLMWRIRADPQIDNEQYQKLKFCGFDIGYKIVIICFTAIGASKSRARSRLIIDMAIFAQAMGLKILPTNKSQTILETHSGGCTNKSTQLGTQLGTAGSFPLVTPYLKPGVEQQTKTAQQGGGGGGEGGGKDGGGGDGSETRSVPVGQGTEPYFLPMRQHPPLAYDLAALKVFALSRVPEMPAKQKRKMSKIARTSKYKYHLLQVRLIKGEGIYGNDTEVNKRTGRTVDPFVRIVCGKSNAVSSVVTNAKYREAAHEHNMCDLSWPDDEILRLVVTAKHLYGSGDVCIEMWDEDIGPSAMGLARHDDMIGWGFADISALHGTATGTTVTIARHEGDDSVTVLGGDDEADEDGFLLTAVGLVHIDFDMQPYDEAMVKRFGPPEKHESLSDNHKRRHARKKKNKGKVPQERQAFSAMAKTVKLEADTKQPDAARWAELWDMQRHCEGSINAPTKSVVRMGKCIKVAPVSAATSEGLRSTNRRAWTPSDGPKTTR